MFPYIIDFKIHPRFRVVNTGEETHLRIHEAWHSFLFIRQSSPNFHQGFVNLHLDTYVFKNQLWLSWIHTGFLPVNLNQGRACHALATKEAFYFGKLTKVIVSTVPEQLSLGKPHAAEATTYPGHKHQLCWLHFSPKAEMSFHWTCTNKGGLEVPKLT